MTGLVEVPKSATGCSSRAKIHTGWRLVYWRMPPTKIAVKSLEVLNLFTAHLLSEFNANRFDFYCSSFFCLCAYGNLYWFQMCCANAFFCKNYLSNICLVDTQLVIICCSVDMFQSCRVSSWKLLLNLLFLLLFYSLC